MKYFLDFQIRKPTCILSVLEKDIHNDIVLVLLVRSEELHDVSLIGLPLLCNRCIHSLIQTCRVFQELCKPPAIIYYSLLVLVIKFISQDQFISLLLDQING